MGHEGFYNSFLVAMGNVVSALFMYALQAAWLCQRLLDQDYRQNHGSRLKPLADCESISEPVEIASEWSVGGHHHHHKLRHPPKPRKPDTTKDSPRQRHSRRRTGGHQRPGATRLGPESCHRLNSSHPYLEGSDSMTTTVEYVNGLGRNLTLRRAFSDINLSSKCSELRYCDSNQNYLGRGSVVADETSTTTPATTVSVTDQDFLRLMFTKGYVT